MQPAALEDWPAAWSRRTSRILRMDNRSAAISSSARVIDRRGSYDGSRVSIVQRRFSYKVAGFCRNDRHHRNRWPASTGIRRWSPDSTSGYGTQQTIRTHVHALCRAMRGVARLSPLHPGSSHLPAGYGPVTSNYYSEVNHAAPGHPHRG